MEEKAWREKLLEDGGVNPRRGRRSYRPEGLRRGAAAVRRPTGGCVVVWVEWGKWGSAQPPSLTARTNTARVGLSGAPFTGLSGRTGFSAFFKQGFLLITYGCLVICITLRDLFVGKEGLGSEVL